MKISKEANSLTLDSSGNLILTKNDIAFRIAPDVANLMIKGFTFYSFPTFRHKLSTTFAALKFIWF